LFFVSENFYRK